MHTNQASMAIGVFVINGTMSTRLQSAGKTKWKRKIWETQVLLSRDHQRHLAWHSQVISLLRYVNHLLFTITDSC